MTRPVHLILMLALLTGCAGPVPEPLPDVPDERREDLVAHIRDNPTDVDAHADLLRMQIRSGDAVGADSTVAHLLKHNEADYRAHLLAGQHHRWQLELINAEKSLLRARDLGPARIEPRVALAGLYRETYLEEDELTQRRLALELADAALRPNFALDLAYSCTQLGRGDEAARVAAALVGDEAASTRLRARAHLLLAEISMYGGDHAGALGQLAAAHKADAEDMGVLQFAARAVMTLDDPAPLGTMFDATLAGRDRAELRWTALFGHWMLSLRAAADPLSPEVEAWRERLDAMEPGHPDVIGRFCQVLRLAPERKDEADALAADLAELGLSAPATVADLDGLRRLWRAEDALRVGAPAVTLREVEALEAAYGAIDGLRLLKMLALFRLRADQRCLAEADAWLAGSESADDLILSIRWWVMLRTGRGLDVLLDLEKRGGANSNSRLWIEAVAKLHAYRQTDK